MPLFTRVIWFVYWTTLRGLGKLSMLKMLTFASMNFKKMPNGLGEVQNWHKYKSRKVAFLPELD